MTPSHLPDCPSWCAVDHDELEGEDAGVHTGDPVHVVDGISARLVSGGGDERAYVLLGDEERSLRDTEELGAALIGLAKTGFPRARAGLGTRSPGPSPAAS